MKSLQALGRRRPAALVNLPSGFAAVGEALAAGSDVEGPCHVAGRQLAEMGAGVDEVLDGLAATYAREARAEPDLAAIRAAMSGWADCSLQHLHGLSCEDPLTGLATTAHLRTRLSEIHRAAECVNRAARDTHALVVVELVDGTAGGDARLTRELRFVDVADAIRAVYPGGETVARVGVHRAVTLVRRGARLGEHVGLLRQLLADWGSASYRHRVWIEGLPPSNEQAGVLLDELAR